MRLTLRALLAHLYLHNLDPAEAEELRKRIEESEFATTLVHRIRSATRRLRLGVPALDGKGMGLDPNTVAEYLEDALSSERVADFEKICLESDVHLAEVASCYEILSLVLSEQAVVSPQLRDRMCELGNPRPDRATEPADADAGVPADAETAGDTAMPIAPPIATESDAGAPIVQIVTEPARTRKTRQVPDYLRAGQRPVWMPLAVTVAVAFLVFLLILRAFGEFNRAHPLMQLLGLAPAPEVAQGRPQPGPGEGGTSPAKPEMAGDASKEAERVPETGSEADAGRRPAKSVVDATPGKIADSSVAKSLPPEATGKPQPEPLRSAVPPVTPGVAKDLPEPAAKEKSPSEPRTGDKTPGGPAVPGVPPEEPKPPKPPVPVAKPETPTGPGAVVGFVKAPDLMFLARHDLQNDAWNRLPSRTQLAAADELIALPTYRPEIVMTPGVQVTFVGPSRVGLLAPTPQGEPGLFMQYGRAVISTAGVPGAKIHLTFGQQHATATFMDATSEMAVDVYRYLAPGVNPERDPAETVAQIYCTVGRIEWRDRAEEAPLPVDAGQKRVLVGGGAETVAVREPPAWIHRENLTPVERLASTTLEPFLSVDRPLNLSLRERTEDRRAEVRSLAARCLAYLGSFDALVKELSDDRQRAHWPNAYDTLRESLSFSPASAARVRGAVESICGNDGQAVYRLLCEFSPQQLQEGAAAQLVDQLNHANLAVRILAFENLRRVTTKTHSYRPEWGETQRKTSWQKWRQELQKGGIIYDTLPSPAPVNR
jgi:hypothetical protein